MRSKVKLDDRPVLDRHPNFRSDLSNSKINELRSQGLTLVAIGQQLGASPTTVLKRLNESDALLLNRVCALPECQMPFKTADPRKIYCVKKHARLGSSRKKLGIGVQRVECALPECRQFVWSSRGNRAYCCDVHADLDYRRWTKCRAYRRLLFGEPKCFVCGEFGVVDEHHVQFSKGKSLGLKKVWLCPTHHMLIHRGFARIDENGVYTRLVESIVADLKRKQPDRVVNIE